MEGFSVDDCKFCNIYNANEIKAVSDTVLYESTYFFVIPALGCIVRDYIMIVSKRHVNSMCYLNAVEKADLENLVNEFRTIFKEKYQFYPIVFEHGASDCDTNKSACCVLHAHIHIVPIKINRQNEMIKNLGLIKTDGYVKFYKEAYNKPYVFFMDNSGAIFYRDIVDTSIPSQVFRKWIAKDIGESDKWDWRIYPFDENVIATIDDLKPIIKERHFSIKDSRLKYVYYCRAIDGLDHENIRQEYDYIQNKLAEQGRVLVNPYGDDEHNQLEINRHNSKLIVSENLVNMSKADCVIVNLSIKDHMYVGCIAEMVYAKLKGCYVIVIYGDSLVEKHFYTLYHSDKEYKTLEELFNSHDW